MDVRIQDLESFIHLVDARSLLTPEVLDEIIVAVREAQRDEAFHDEHRQLDRQLDRQATQLG